MKRNEESYWRKFDIADNEKRLHTTVRDVLNAWLSYALDAPGLMAKSEPLTSEDIEIESIAPSSTASGMFDLTVSIAGAEIGEGTQLAETLGIEGAAELKESAFSSEGLVVSLERTADGKAKATVASEGSPTSSSLRVRAAKRPCPMCKSHFSDVQTRRLYAHHAAVSAKFTATPPSVLPE